MSSYRDYIPEPRERDDELEALARQRAENLRRHRAFLRNPDPRDPDYEGAGEARDE